MAKIHINLQQGIIDIEGDEQFVREAFAEVRTSMSNIHVVTAPHTVSPLPANKIEQQVAKPKQRPKHRPRAKAEQGEAGGGGIGSYYKATFNPNLDLAGLGDFLKLYCPANKKERVLVYTAFLRDALNRSPCTADDIYSCFWAMKSEASIPEAFGKNLNDARREGFIAYSGPSDVTIPTAGENALIRLGKKVAA